MNIGSRSHTAVVCLNKRLRGFVPLFLVVGAETLPRLSGIRVDVQLTGEESAKLTIQTDQTHSLIMGSAGSIHRCCSGLLACKQSASAGSEALLPETMSTASTLYRQQTHSAMSPSHAFIPHRSRVPSHDWTCPTWEDAAGKKI